MGKGSAAFRGLKRLVLGYFILSIVVLTFIGIMSSCGYPMADIGVEFTLFGLLICAAAAAGAVWLVRRIKRSGVRIVAGALLAVVIMALAFLVISGLSFLKLVYAPSYYTTLHSPEGKPVVLLRRIRMEEERVAERRAARAADAEADGLNSEDLGYCYEVHPRVLRWFYDEETAAEGDLEIGMTSQATLMHEWTNGGLRLYVDAPEAGDGGELFFPLS